MTQPKVTLAQWRERVQLNANGNTGTIIGQPGTITDTGSISADNSIKGGGISKGPVNPLHPDLQEEVGRLRATVQVMKTQIYGSSIPGELGLVQHLLQVDDEVNRLAGSISGLSTRLAKMEDDYRQLLELLGVEDDDGKTQ